MSDALERAKDRLENLKRLIDAAPPSYQGTFANEIRIILLDLIEWAEEPKIVTFDIYPDQLDS